LGVRVQVPPSAPALNLNVLGR